MAAADNLSLTPISGNLLDPTAVAGGQERVDPLFQSAELRIERIVSNRYQSPAGFWYDQDDDEFVVLIAGEATLEFSGGNSRVMNAGDWVLIPAHVPHRIAHTDAGTVWLAIHAQKRVRS